MLKALMLKVLLASLALFLSAAAALAEDWPTKPITVLMGFPAGSGVDAHAAALARPIAPSSAGAALTRSSWRAVCCSSVASRSGAR
jgi:tripartite-type tricarboxylate transporter receptor subunit TctC